MEKYFPYFVYEGDINIPFLEFNLSELSSSLTQMENEKEDFFSLKTNKIEMNTK